MSAGKGFILGLLVGALLGALLMGMAVLGVPHAEAGPWLCPPSRTDTTTVLQEHVRPKPAAFAVVYDSAYSTCWQRITTDTKLDGNGPTPIYSQLQMLNSDQTKIIFNNGLLLNFPSFTVIDSTNALPGNFRWSPVFPDTGYYSANNSGTTQIPTFNAYNVVSRGIRAVRAFPEYRKLQISQEQEDVDETGRFVVLQGYTHGSPAGLMPVGDGSDPDTMQIKGTITSGNPVWSPTLGAVSQTDSLEVGADVSGTGIPRDTHILSINRSTKAVTFDKNPTSTTSNAIVTFSNSEAFVFNVQTGWKGRAIPTWNTIGTGVADMLMSPTGKHMILNWGGGVGCTDSLTCGIISYDTTGAYEGKVVGSVGHFDLTIDKDGTEYCVLGLANSDTPPPRSAVARCLIPNGWNLWNANRATGIIDLVPYPSFGANGGIHVSGRAFRSGYVIISSDDDFQTRQPRQVFSNEIVRVFLDSRRQGTGTPHIERLADARSDAYVVYHSSCPLSYYWASAHATISRDGTRVFWGSSWHDSVSCLAETYMMDVSRNGYNPTYVNQTANTWVRHKARAIKSDGTGGAPADTSWPYQTYSHAVFAPEWGSIIYWGGGGHGDRQGNDVWMYDTADTLWRQKYMPDSLALNQYPGGKFTGSGNYAFSVRSLYQLPGGVCGVGPDSCAYTVVNLNPQWPYAWGMTRNGRPWTSHSYQQMVWIPQERKYGIFGPNYFASGNPDSGISDNWWYFGSRSSAFYDPFLNTWQRPTSMPNVYSQNGCAGYDPIARKMVAFNSDVWHTPSGSTFVGNQVWAMDTTQTWTEKAKPSSIGTAPSNSAVLYGVTNHYARSIGKLLFYPVYQAGNPDTSMYTYSAVSNAWAQVFPLKDPTNGKPPNSDPLSAYDTKNNKLLVWGKQGNSVPGGTSGTGAGPYVKGPWVYDIASNQWTKMNSTGEPADTTDGFGNAKFINPITYDPTNNIFFVIRQSGANNQCTGTGDCRANFNGSNYGAVGELYTYKLTSGDGVLFPPITPTFGGGGGPPPSCGGSSGL